MCFHVQVDLATGVRITYQEDEIEILIRRILSFGPVACFKGTEHFVGLMRERLQRQQALLQEKEKLSREAEEQDGTV